MSNKEIILVKEDISSIARYHYTACLIFFFSVLLFILAVGAVLLGVTQEHRFARYFNVVDLSFRIGAMVCIFKLATSLKEPRPWIYIGGMIFPLVNFVVLAYLIHKTTRVLRANNIRVGFLGCSKEDLNNYLSGNWERK